MDRSDEIRTLLAAAAVRSAAVDTVTRLGEDEFEIALDDGRSILAEFDPASGRLMFSTELGLPPDARRAEVVELLFSYNLLWRETGGVRAASAGVREPILLMLDIFVAGYDAERLAAAINDFSTKAEIWGDYVGAVDTAFEPPLPANFAMIRN